MYLVQYEDLPFFFSWGWWRGGVQVGSGGLTFNILASYPGQEVEIFLVKECYRNMDFFSARYAVRLVCRLDDIYVTVFFLFLSPLLEFVPVIRFLTPVRLACMMVRLLSTMWEVGVIHRLLTVCKNYIFCECMERPSLLFLKGETRNTRSMVFFYWWMLRSEIRYLKCGDLAR